MRKSDGIVVETQSSDKLNMKDTITKTAKDDTIVFTVDDKEKERGANMIFTMLSSSVDDWTVSMGKSQSLSNILPKPYHILD